MKTLHDFNERFGTEKQCLAYLYRLRWPDGYRCPRCYHNEAWQVKEWKYKCRKCGYQSTVTAGTIFQDSHLPITLWFKAIWYICSQTGGANALDLQKQLNIGSYRTAWMILQKIRKLMADNAPIKLSGRIAVDSYTVHRTRHAKKVRFFIGAELLPDRKVGNICIGFTQDITDKDVLDFCREHIKKESKVVSAHFPKILEYYDKSFIYEQMQSKTYNYRVFLPPIFEIVKYLENHQLLRTQQLSSSREHMDYYLAECCYKFNRRNRTTTEMFEEILYSAVRTDPLTNSNVVTEKEKPPQN